MKHFLTCLALLLLVSAGCDQSSIEPGVADSPAIETAPDETPSLEQSFTSADVPVAAEAAEAIVSAESTATEAEVDAAETDVQLVAREVLDSAISSAKADGRNVFVHFTADW